jgi:predicted transglutaminase-like cysteine proteinase
MPEIRLVGMFLVLFLLTGVCGCSSSMASARPTDEKPGAEKQQPLIPPGKGLFRSHEFRSRLKGIPNWERVLRLARTQVRGFESCDPGVGECPTAALSWQKIIRQARQLTGLEQLRVVNAYFNRWPYRLDIDAYGVSDYWATPGEFLRLSGDCEDFSIVKYYALRSLGFPADNLRIVLLWDNIRGIPHSVLTVQRGQETWVLDSITDLVLSHLKYEHYVPQYSVNEFYRWAHVAPTGVK